MLRRTQDRPNNADIGDRKWSIVFMMRIADSDGALPDHLARPVHLTDILLIENNSFNVIYQCRTLSPPL